MRIISGKYKSRKLVFKKSQELRPTQDRVKESIFNIIASKISDSTCLDLFAGSGSLGFEAISRGAKRVDFVDVDVEYVKKNHILLKEDSAANIFRTNALSFLKNKQSQYDIIFLDPPWKHLHFFDRSLKAIFEFDILKKNGIVVCEHPVKIFEFYSFNVINQKTFGDKTVSILEILNEKSIISG